MSMTPERIILRDIAKKFPSPPIHPANTGTLASIAGTSELIDTIQFSPLNPPFDSIHPINPDGSIESQDHQPRSSDVIIPTFLVADQGGFDNQQTLKNT